MPAEPCTFCGSDRTRRVRIRDGLEYDICSNCGHARLGPDDTSPADAFLASQGRYFGHESLLFEDIEDALKSEVLRKRKSLFSRFAKPPADVLEVGPGLGEFFAWVRGAGYNALAVEASPPIARAMVEQTGAKVHVGPFEQNTLPENSVDVFCSFHVIEHVPDPRAHLAAAAGVTRPGGLAFIATPNGASWEHRLFARLSPNFDSAHLHVFTPRSLRDLATACGWRVIREETPEYSSGWLRVLSKAMRRFRGEDEETTAGKYATRKSGPTRALLGLFQAISFPLRTLQARLGRGNEIFVVLRREPD